MQYFIIWRDLEDVHIKEVNGKDSEFTELLKRQNFTEIKQTYCLFNNEYFILKMGTKP